MRDSALYKEPVDPAKWFGIRKDATVLGYSQVWLMYFLQPVIMGVTLIFYFFFFYLLFEPMDNNI